MNKLLSCHYNMDTNRVEARFTDNLPLPSFHRRGGDEYSNTPAQANWTGLLYSKPLEYAQMVLVVRWNTTSPLAANTAD